MVTVTGNHLYILGSSDSRKVGFGAKAVIGVFLIEQLTKQPPAKAGGLE